MNHLSRKDRTFKIIHSSHCDDPSPPQKEMVRVTKKDRGVIAIRESDLRAWSFHTEAAGLQICDNIHLTCFWSWWGIWNWWVIRYIFGKYTVQYTLGSLRTCLGSLSISSKLDKTDVRENKSQIKCDLLTS